MLPSTLHNRGRKCAQHTRKWNSPAHHTGVGWCRCDWLYKSIGHSWNEPDGMMVVILRHVLLVCDWKFLSCVTLWTCLPRDLENSLYQLPEHPSTSLGSFGRAFNQAGSDINGSKLKIYRRTDYLRCPGPVFVKEDTSHRLHKVMLTEGCRRAPHWRDRQTHWKLSESNTDWVL